MTTVNQGRNEIRFNNSGGKCLLENWVEERAVAHIDPQDLNEDTTSGAQLYKEGHKALLTQKEGAQAEKITTVRESYKPPQGPGVRLKGTRAEQLEKFLYEAVSQEVHNEFNPPPPPVEYNSVTHKDFNIIGFVSEKPKPTANHDYIKDQPATFWTEHKDSIHGVSQVKTADTPFKKNAAFSTPIDEYMDQPKPYEHDNVPNM